jgi:hypothetical protein
MLRRTIGALSAFWLLTVALGEPLLSRPTLVSTEWLASHLNDPRLRIVDARPRPLCLSAGAHSGRRLSAYRDPADFAGWCARAAAVSSTAGGRFWEPSASATSIRWSSTPAGQRAISLPMQPMWRSCWNRLGIAPSAYWMAASRSGSPKTALSPSRCHASPRLVSKPRPNRSMLLDAEQLWKGIQQKSLQVLDARKPSVVRKGAYPLGTECLSARQPKRRQGSNLARQNRVT